MFKLLITGLIVYFLYRVFFKHPALNGPTREERKIEQEKQEKSEEYIDYDEVD